MLELTWANLIELEPSWDQLGAYLGELGITRSSLSRLWSQLGAYLGELGANLDELGPILRQVRMILGPTWLQKT